MKDGPGLEQDEIAMPTKQLAIIAGWARRMLQANPGDREASTQLRLVTEVLLMRSQIAELQAELVDLRKKDAR